MRVLELFPCSGGLSEGLRRAGIPATMAFDYSADACESHERNQGLRPFQVDARDLLRMVQEGWTPGPIDLFVADPPCTPWSRAGKRLGEDDTRDMLAVTVELVRVLRPRAYLIANVPGLDDGPNLPVVQRTIGSLGAEGYCVADFARLDAADYGVPQHRIRPFWFGHLDGPCLVWPSRTHGSPEECSAPILPGVDRLRPWVTCREALGHLAPDELGKPIRLQWKSNCHQRGNSITTRGEAARTSIPRRSLSRSCSISSPTSPTQAKSSSTRSRDRGQRGWPRSVLAGASSASSASRSTSTWLSSASARRSTERRCRRNERDKFRFSEVRRRAAAC